MSKIAFKLSTIAGLPATFSQEFTGLQEAKCNFTADLQEIFPLNTGELYDISLNTGKLQDIFGDFKILSHY